MSACAPGLEARTSATESRFRPGVVKADCSLGAHVAFSEGAFIFLIVVGEGFLLDDILSGCFVSVRGSSRRWTDEGSEAILVQCQLRYDLFIVVARQSSAVDRSSAAAVLCAHSPRTIVLAVHLGLMIRGFSRCLKWTGRTHKQTGLSKILSSSLCYQQHHSYHASITAIYRTFAPSFLIMSLCHFLVRGPGVGSTFPRST